MMTKSTIVEVPVANCDLIVELHSHSRPRYTSGERVWKNLQEARDFASANGFAGIEVVPTGDKP
jgi:hypothetical protein